MISLSIYKKEFSICTWDREWRWRCLLPSPAWYGLYYHFLATQTMFIAYIKRRIFWCRGVEFLTVTKVQWTKPQVRFCAGSNPVLSVLEVCECENFWPWSPFKHLHFKRQPYKMITHHSNNSSATADKLFQCVWPFCGVGA